MNKRKNDSNDSSKRTSRQIAAILNDNGVAAKPENMGDGRTFVIRGTELRTRIAVKRAGFKLELGRAGDKHLIFKAY